MNPRGDAPIRACGDKEFVGRTRKQKVLPKFEIIGKQLRKIQQKKGYPGESTSPGWNGGGEIIRKIFVRSTKHSWGVVRLYKCSRNRGCSG
jgi:hypothetical protein